MSNKTKNVLLGLFALIVIIGSVWYAKNSWSSKESSQIVSQNQAKADLKEYKNDDMEISFSYPSSFGNIVFAKKLPGPHDLIESGYNYNIKFSGAPNLIMGAYSSDAEVKGVGVTEYAVYTSVSQLSEEHIIKMFSKDANKEGIVFVPESCLDEGCGSDGINPIPLSTTEQIAFFTGNKKIKSLVVSINKPFTIETPEVIQMLNSLKIFR